MAERLSLNGNAEQCLLDCLFEERMGMGVEGAISHMLLFTAGIILTKSLLSMRLCSGTLDIEFEEASGVSVGVQYLFLIVRARVTGGV